MWNNDNHSRYQKQALATDASCRPFCPTEETMKLRTWSFIHKWTSLICTIFLLLLCISGLPLIFHEEIEHLSGEAEAPEMAADTPELSMDRMVEAAQKRYPEKVVRYMRWHAEEHPHVTYVHRASANAAAPDDRCILARDSRPCQ